MRAEDVVGELRKQPFEPFRLYLTGGTSYEVRHPDMAIVFPAKMIVAIPGTTQPHLAERYHMIALSHVMRLVPLDAAASPASN